MTEIKGYRELSDFELGFIERVKAAAEVIDSLVDEVRSVNGGADFDQRWVSIAATDLQKGFMALIRAIAQPTTF